MDVGSISSNALGSLLGGLALLLLIHISRKVFEKLTQHEKLPREVLSEALRKTPEYEWFLQSRKTYRRYGYMSIFAFLTFVTAFVINYIFTKTIIVNASYIVIPVLLLILIPLTLYLGFSPITAHEVELKRQKNRERTLHQALGAKPYGYIFRSIIFPAIILVYAVFCVVMYVLLFLDPNALHLSTQWIVIGIISILLVGLYSSYILTKIIYQSIKYLKYVPLQKWRELRKEIFKDEFK